MLRILLLGLLLTLSLSSKTVTQQECTTLQGEFIFSGGECIEYGAFTGETKKRLIVIVHGAWKEGTNILARYKPFAENINLDTDITTVAVSLPGYSRSSHNRIQALTHNKNALKTASSKEFVDFLATLLHDLKTRYQAKYLIVIAHSAGAMTVATLLGYKPGLIQTAALAGGRYDIHKIDKDTDLISAVDYVNAIPKSTKILLIYGEKDTVSKPQETKSFYTLAKKEGLNVKLLEVKDAQHLDLDMQEKSIEAFENMLKKLK